MDEIESFQKQVCQNLAGLTADQEMRDLSNVWLRHTIKHQYSYNFTCLGRPIIQYPQDMIAIQELIWRVQPDLIIETGIAHGGSLILSASMLALLDYCDAAAQNKTLNILDSQRKVIGIDIDIRQHNREAVEAHPLAHKIKMIQGSSIANEVIEEVGLMARDYKRVMLFLDSNHTHDHVLAELEAYAPLVSRGSYCCVFDTIVEDLPKELYKNRPWGPGNNPKTAVWEYLRRLNDAHQHGDKDVPIFEIDKNIQNKLLITVAPDGYLKRVR